MNPSDTTIAICRETVEGTINAAPAFVNLDYLPGNTFDMDSKTLTSEVMKASREVAAVRKTAFVPNGSIKTDFRRDTAFDLLLESAFSGRFASNVLKGSNVDSFHTIEVRSVEEGSPMFWRYKGMQVTKFSHTVDANAKAEASYEFIGTGRDEAKAIVASATYALPTQGILLTGDDVGTLTIDGLTNVRYMGLELSVGHTREGKMSLGSATPWGTGTSGNREVKLTVKAFRRDIDVDTLSKSDTPRAVRFDIGTGANGMRFDLPAAVFDTLAKNEVNGANALVTLSFTATLDATAATGIMLTKLA